MYMKDFALILCCLNTKSKSNKGFVELWFNNNVIVFLINNMMTLLVSKFILLSHIGRWSLTLYEFLFQFEPLKSIKNKLIFFTYDLLNMIDTRTIELKE